MRSHLATQKSTQSSFAPSESRLLQRRTHSLEKPTATPPVLHEALNLPIQPKDGLPKPVQTQMETAFNTNFTNVRIYPNSQKAVSIGAIAYTQGNDIHFAPGKFQPDSHSGQALLGHELAHVIQQRQGQVKATTQVEGLPVNNDLGLEAEADAMGRKAALKQKVHIRSGSLLHGAGGTQLSEAPIQMVIANTVPVWGAPSPASGGEAVSMRVDRLGPRHAIGSETTNIKGTVSVDRATLFTAATDKAEYCQGHLLGHEMGGPGNRAYNLTAFPQKPTNSDHKNQVENEINGGLRAGDWYFYQVDVSYGQAEVIKLIRGLSIGNIRDYATNFSASGINKATDLTYYYANRLTCQWHELDSNTGARVGSSKKVVFNIPSPNSYISTQKERKEEYPGLPFKTFDARHMSKYAEDQSWTYYENNVQQRQGRNYIAPQSTQGLRDAQSGAIDMTSTNRLYIKGYTDYRQGSAIASANPTQVMPAGQSVAYQAGYEDYQNGYNAAVASPNQMLPVVGQSVAYNAAYQEYQNGYNAAVLNPTQALPIGGQSTAYNDAYQHYQNGYNAAILNPTQALPVGQPAAYNESYQEYQNGYNAAVLNPTQALPIGGQSIAYNAAYRSYQNGYNDGLNGNPAAVGQPSAYAEGWNHGSLNRRKATLKVVHGSLGSDGTPGKKAKISP